MGLPSILHSDNGREFVNSVITEILNDWPGQVQLVSGRPHHPQSQGVVEQDSLYFGADAVCQSSRAKNSVVNLHVQGGCLILFVCVNIMLLIHALYRRTFTFFRHHQVHETTKAMPYELVFGQPPRSIIIPGPRLKGTIDEEQLDEKDGDIIDDEVVKEEEECNIDEPSTEDIKQETYNEEIRMSC